jgi:Saccharopine dehydrogenase NADP binding domain
MAGKALRRRFGEARRMIGLLGATGAVGQATAAELRALAAGDLRLGARRRTSETLDSAAKVSIVDIDDDDALARFCADCRVVVNCAGPSHRFLDRVALAALSAGADYVDAAGDDPVHERLASFVPPAGEHTVIVSAGMMPGLSGLLPRWLASHGFDRLDRLTAYVGGLDRFTLAAAGDYLASLRNGYGESLASWRNGRRAPATLEPLRDIELPFFAGPITAYPFLSTETERLARALKIGEVNWYNVFGDGRALAAISRLHGSIHAGVDLDVAAVELVAAAEIDVAGRTPYQLLVFQLDGETGGMARTRSLMLRARDSYRLTGCVAAFATAVLLRGDVHPGLHYAADVLDPEGVVERLRETSIIAALEAFDEPLAANDTIERGTL